MPKHSLSFKLPRTVDVENKDFEFLIYSKDRPRSKPELMGTLKVSKGSLDWRPGNAELTRVLKWERFAELAEKHGSRRIKV
jgi:hypothetical protein